MSNGRVALMVAALVLAAATGWGEAGKGQSKPGNKAQPAGKSAPLPRPKAPAPSKHDAPAKPSEPVSSAPPLAPMGRGEARSTAPSPAPADAGVMVSEKDGGSKQFRFTETEVEGRLKAPQLVYFLRRVRAEFAAGDLGHRSFMRELSETQRETSF
jgi:hypothetical protein